MEGEFWDYNLKKFVDWDNFINIGKLIDALEIMAPKDKYMVESFKEDSTTGNYNVCLLNKNLKTRVNIYLNKWAHI